MSDLRPRRKLVKLGEEEFWLLFSLEAIDEIQSTLNRPIFDVVDLLMKAAKAETDQEALTVFLQTFACLIWVNYNKEVTAMELLEKLTAENYCAGAKQLLQLFWECMPEDDEYDPEDNDEEEDKEPERIVNVARLLHIGVCQLGYSEKEVFGMTLRKFYLLFDEYLRAKGIKKDEDIDEDRMFC